MKKTPEKQPATKPARGAVLKRLTLAPHTVALAPDVALAFPDSESVNRALRALIAVSRELQKPN